MRKTSNPFLEIYRSESYSSPYNYPLTEFPSIIDIEVTNKCNLDCIMCPRQVLTRPEGFMELELFKKITNEIASEGGKGMRFIGYGEPILNPDTFEMIEYAHSKKLLTHLTTNGVLLDETKIKKILDCELDSIIFSLQGTTKAEYIKMRENPFYDKIVENIKKLVNERNKRNSNKPFIQVTTTLLDETKADIESFYNKWDKIVDRVDHWYTNLKYISHLKRVKSLLKRQKIDKHVGTGRCTEVRTKLTIFWNGNVSACCGDFNGELIVGSVLNNSLKEIWNSNQLNNIRDVLSRNERSKLPLCSKCTNKFLEK